MRTIFVSSTFGDMQYERDAFRYHISPAINDIARQYNDHVEFCDLRWGINTEGLDSDEASTKVLDVCLDEIDRSNPPMIILLGERYGWIPEKEYISNIAERKRIQLDSLRKSVTALEAEYGSITLGRKALIYLRTIECSDDSLEGIYLSEGDEHVELLEKLKIRLSNLPNCTVNTYSVEFKNGKADEDDIDNFSKQVIQDLSDVLLPDWERFSNMTPFQRERERQWTFIREKNEMFTARFSDAVQLLEEIDEGRQIVICKGLPGSGKSTLLSHICIEAQKEGWNVLPFIGGLTDESNDGMDILRNSVFYLETELGKEHLSNATAQTITSMDSRDIPTIEEWQERFVKLSREYEKSENKLLIAIDAVDQLFPDEIRDECAFIPPGLSNSVHFFITSLPMIDFPEKRFHALNPLSEDDIKHVINGVLSRFGKELSDRVVKKIIGMKNADNPYYVSMLVQRLCMMRIEDFQKANASDEAPIIALGNKQIEIIEDCPEDIEEMSVKLLTDAANILGSPFLFEAMNYIAMTRYGLRRNDLAAIIGEEWNELEFAHFLNLLYEDFQLRSDGRIDFMHRTIREGLRKRVPEGIQYHNTISHYLEKLHPHDSIRMKEYPYHLLLSKNVEKYSAYIDAYELGDKADTVITNCAALTTRTVCLEEGITVISRAIEKCIDKSYAVSLLWFVTSELAEIFDESFNEKLVRVKLLEKTSDALDALDLQGRLSNRNRELFYEKIALEIIHDHEVADDSLCARMGKILLEINKEKYINKDIVDDLCILFKAYYHSVYAHKGSEKELILREGIEIAKEGEILLNTITEKGYFTSLAGPFYGCIGEIYDRLNDKNSCVITYLKDCEFREKQYEKTKSAEDKMMLTGGYMNVAHSYERINDPEGYINAYKYYVNAIDCFESAMSMGADIIMQDIPVRAYFGACEAYIRMSSGKAIDIAEFERNTIYGLKSFDYARKVFRESQSPSMFVWIRRISAHVSKMMVTNQSDNEVLDIFLRWISEDENEQAIAGEKNNTNNYIMLETFFIVANIIQHSSFIHHYNLALECCNKGVATANQLAGNASIFSDSWEVVLEEKEIIFKLNVLHEIRYKLSRIIYPDKKEPISDFILYEESKYKKTGVPSLRLASLNIDLSEYFASNTDTLHLALKPLLRAKEVYDHIIMHEQTKGGDTEIAESGIRKVDKLIMILNPDARRCIKLTDENKEIDVRKIMRSIKRGLQPIEIKDADYNTVMNAIDNYASNVNLEDVVAIEPAGLFSRGKKGVLYTKNAIYSSELAKGECIPYTSLYNVYQHADGLKISFIERDSMIVDFGKAQDQVFEIIKGVLKSGDN